MKIKKNLQLFLTLTLAIITCFSFFYTSEKLINHGKRNTIAVVDGAERDNKTTTKRVNEERCIISGAYAGQIKYVTTCTGTTDNDTCYFYINGRDGATHHIAEKYVKYTNNSACNTSSGTPSTSTGSTSSTGTGTTATTDTSFTAFPNAATEFRYAQTGSYVSGDYFSCGDKLVLSECNSTYCHVATINGNSVKTTTTVKKNFLAPKNGDPIAKGTCTATRYTSDSFYYTDSGLTQGKTSFPCGSQVTFTESPGDACTKDSCMVKYNGATVYLYRTSLYGEQSVAKSKCSNNTCKNSEPQKDVKTTVEVTICGSRNSKSEGFDFDGVTTESLVTCAAGYKRGQDNVLDQTACDTASDSLYCTNLIKVTCSQSVKPYIALSGSVADTNGKGSLSLEGTDNGSGITGYFISTGESPTKESNWTPFDKQNDKKYTSTITNQDVGTYFAWDMSKDDNISYPVMARIFSKDITTTATDLTLTDGEGNNISPVPADGDTTGYEETVSESGYVRLSNTLKNDSVLAAFDPFTTGYSITVNSNKIAVYATLTSTDSSYVAGYEPRTVDLNYGRNVILIKIQNKKGHIRTYTIIANRPDDRELTNTLKDLTVSVGSISFDSYVSDYNIEVPKNTNEVTINGTLTSTKATFVEGYEPRKVTLDNDVTSAVVKVKGESGNVRSYVLTFVKSGASTKETATNSTYLSSLAVAGTYLRFDKKTFNYSITVGYETVTLPVYAFGESSKATVAIEGNLNLAVGNNTISITVTNNGKTRLYTITVIRKEDGLGVSDDTTLGTLTVQGYNINFKSDVLDYVIKIKHEKTLVITATPNSNRSDVYMYGNNDLTGFSTVRIKVIAEDGDTKIYSIDIRKDAYNKTIEITAAIIGVVIIIGATIIIVIRRKKKKMKDYMGE